MPKNIFYNSIKNWDNKTWLSSPRYIQFFNDFLVKHTRLNKSSKIIDVGCGRGKILGYLSIKLRFKTKPLGIDLKNHKDKNKKLLKDLIYLVDEIQVLLSQFLILNIT